MEYDSQVPSDLKQTQAWFASIIARPIDKESRMNPIAPSGVAMDIEAPTYITPSPHLQPAERIQIYNQQYWWRLLNTLQESFPLVVRLFGYTDFNFQIAFPYLSKYPPCHWTLNVLGDNLPRWVQEDYQAADQTLIAHAAAIDCAFTQGFTAAHHPSLTSELELSGLLDVKLFLQPHLFLIKMPYDLLAFRQLFLKESPDYWVDHDFPQLAQEQEGFYVMFRKSSNDMSWCKVSSAEFGLLEQFKRGCSISEACEWLEGQDESLVAEASQHLERWFKEWVVRQWLTQHHA